MNAITMLQATSVPSMYVRVKRRKMTVFLHVDPSDTPALLKIKLTELLQEPVAKQRLIKGNNVLDDTLTLAELRIENDDVLALSIQSEEGGFDDPAIVQPEDESVAEHENEPVVDAM